MQRYLSGSSVTQSRLGLLFNGMVKVPMQFGILLVGATLFALVSGRTVHEATTAQQQMIFAATRPAGGAWASPTRCCMPLE